MKKGKLLIVLLCASASCMNVAIATTVQPKKTVHKNVTDSHKKNKAKAEHKITEKDIAACTSLINRVSQKEMTVVPAAIPPSTSNNTKIAEHLQKPADVQLFASDDPKAIAHLTGKLVLPPVTPVIKPVATSIPAKSTTELKVPPPASKHVTKSTDKHNKPAKPVSTHQAGNPKAVATPATIKTTLTPKHPTTNSIAKAPTTTVVKPKTVSMAPSQPHIELFTPNTPDLEHLEGKSANLENLQNPAPTVKSSAVEHQKNKKLTNKKKGSSASITRANAKKETSSH